MNFLLRPQIRPINPEEAEVTARQPAETPVDAGLPNSFRQPPLPAVPVETAYRRVVTPLPAPPTVALVEEAASLFPAVNCYQPPVAWDRAEGFQVFDSAGNRWIDFSSTAVTTNTGHGHPRIREALREHLDSGLLAQFNFLSEIRVRLARRLVELAPEHCDRVYFWTTGSEAIESALRLAREHGRRIHPAKDHILALSGDYHGCTLGAHQLSGPQAAKPWLPHPDAHLHRLPFPWTPRAAASFPAGDAEQPQVISGDDEFTARLTEIGISPDDVAAVFIETLQGWGAVPLPIPWMHRLRDWATRHNILLIFDEVQTGFGRTGRLFGHTHYGVRADLICIGKGVTSSLPLAAVLGPAELIDCLPPGEVTTTHAGHPLSCVAALANLDVLEAENLVAEAERLGQIARDELRQLQERFPDWIHAVCGLGLLQAIHLQDPATGQPSREVARRLTLAAVRHGVMLFHTNHPTVKICPPLVIGDDALREGISALGDALAEVAAGW